MLQCQLQERTWTRLRWRSSGGHQLAKGQTTITVLGFFCTEALEENQHQSIFIRPLCMQLPAPGTGLFIPANEGAEYIAVYSCTMIKVKTLCSVTFVLLLSTQTETMQSSNNVVSACVSISINQTTNVKQQALADGHLCKSYPKTSQWACLSPPKSVFASCIWVWPPQ